MAVEYERALADLNKALPDPNVADSVADILLDKLNPRLPGSGTISTLTAANVNTEVDSGLDTAIPASPIANSVNERIKTIDDDLNDGGRIDLLIDGIKAKTDTIAASSVSTASATTAGVIVQDGTTGTPNVVTCVADTANTFGAWAQIDASTSAVSWISHVAITVKASNSAYRDFVVEIGTGAAGSEVTKLRFSFLGGLYSNAGSMIPAVFALPIPIRVAAGVRIAARAAPNTTSANGTVAVGLSFYQSLET